MYRPFWLVVMSLLTPQHTISQGIDKQHILNPSLDKNCSVSHISTNDIVIGDVSISAYDPFSNNEFAKMPHLNASAWELWYFDAVSSTGDAAITISFFRDGSQSLIEKGSLRTQFHAIWPDGSTFGTEHFAADSIMESCPEVIKGYWNGEEGSTSFEISQDLAIAILHLDFGAVKGTLSFSASAQSFPADGDLDPPPDASKILAPTVYWLQALPRASVEAVFSVEDKQLHFTGSGGHDRFWTPYSWMTLMHESYYMRAIAGPYTVVLLRIISRVDPGRTYISASLFNAGQQIFGTQKDQVSIKDDYVSFQLTYHGTLRGKFRDTNTGYVIDLVSPVKDKHWRFNLSHSSLWWDLPTGPVTGNTGFVDTATGGEVGGEQHQGSGTAGQCQLPP